MEVLHPIWGTIKLVSNDKWCWKRPIAGGVLHTAFRRTVNGARITVWVYPTGSLVPAGVLDDRDKLWRGIDGCNTEQSWAEMYAKDARNHRKS